MIYTVTLNPSLDYIVSVPGFSIGKTNRTVREQLLPGGKGINVSCVLRHLGIDSTAVGFTAGFVGEEIIRRLKDYGIDSRFTQLPEGNSRINVKLICQDGTEINASGPAIPQSALQSLKEELAGLGKGDYLVLAGSVPPSVSVDIYMELACRAKQQGCRVVVDAAGELLRKVLSYEPFLIKPNLQELRELFDAEIQSAEEAARYARQLQRMGARNVLVSMGGDGALIAAEDGCIWSSPAPKGTVINSVGAGDSMVAGFLAGWVRSQDYKKAFLLGIAAGSASAFSDRLAEEPEIAALYQTLARSAMQI